MINDTFRTDTVIVLWFVLAVSAVGAAAGLHLVAVSENSWAFCWGGVAMDLVAVTGMIKMNLAIWRAR